LIREVAELKNWRAATCGNARYCSIPGTGGNLFCPGGWRSVSKDGGISLYLFQAGHDDIPGPLIEHGRELGLSLMDSDRRGEYGVEQSGAMFLKSRTTDMKFPRPMAVIKREIKKYLGNIETQQFNS